MQKLRPCRPGGDMANQHRMHHRCGRERDWEPKHRAQDHEQCGVRSKVPAFPEHPCHPALKGIMHSLFERPIADLAPQPRPMSADRPATLETFRLRKGKEADKAT